jgi:transposase
MEKVLFESALGIEKPLMIEEIKFDKEVGELHVHINFERGGKFSCSGCDCEGLPAYDTVPKKWRHLNFFQYQCYIHLRTPRTQCPACGVLLWYPSWSRPDSGFTLLFEAFIMTLVKDMPVSSIAELIDEHDTKIWRVIKHHTSEAYAQKDFSDVVEIGCDETSSKKGHNYVTIFANMATRKVIYATPGKNADTIRKFVAELPSHSAVAEQIKEITIDMSPAFISGVKEHLPNATITFDKFHVVKLLNEALDEVRRREQKDNPILKRSRYAFLKNPVNLTQKQELKLEDLIKTNLRTAKVYQMKLVFQDIYNNIKDPKEAEAALKKWLMWADRSRLEPIRKFSKTVKNHWDGIMRYFTSRLTSGVMEGLNSRIQTIKRRARGFRNLDNFISLIYLEMADLDINLPT